MASITCAHCRQTHASVAEVRACATGGNLITREHAEKELTDAGFKIRGEVNRIRTYLNVPYDEKNKAKEQGARWDSARRQWWVPEEHVKAYPEDFKRWLNVEAAPKTVVPVDDDYYVFKGEYYKVVHNQLGTSQYAQRLVENPEGSKRPFSWAYDPGTIKLLRPEMRLTAEQAGDFGALYGACCMCGAELSRTESKDRGYGPVCADKNGFPYDHSNKD